MFEKEAEDYTNFVKSTKERWNCDKIFYADVELAYQKGAEFGYNKANEWHYVKDELPPEDVPLLCMRGGNVYVAWFILGKWKGDKYNDVKKPYAWKEIVLPKEEQKEKEQNKDWMYQQRERNELGADYFSYQGYHPPKN